MGLIKKTGKFFGARLDDPGKLLLISAFGDHPDILATELTEDEIPEQVNLEEALNKKSDLLKPEGENPRYFFIQEFPLTEGAKEIVNNYTELINKNIENIASNIQETRLVKNNNNGIIFTFKYSNGAYQKFLPFEIMLKIPKEESYEGFTLLFNPEEHYYTPILNLEVVNTMILYKKEYNDAQWMNLFSYKEYSKYCT